MYNEEVIDQKALHHIDSIDSIMGMKRELDTKVAKDHSITSTLLLKVKTEQTANPLRSSDLKSMAAQAEKVMTKRMEEVVAILQELGWT
ncbi:hypothetical protein J0K78_11620 [Halobacillus sp. GSS1]|uniref:hypothetical protein n=1 Tax=Halobacillus sp. GSS1 TaxID=2815919 RepID=UPI001A8EC544|nr:hypothetical protein [Halobacillus sp. GSS1]MBN9654917.1 hypothetical protein [Halobacillus sp. GSS1]